MPSPEAWAREAERAQQIADERHANSPRRTPGFLELFAVVAILTLLVAGITVAVLVVR